MIKQAIYKILILIFTTNAVMAQGGLSIKATVDKNNILIGEHFTLRLEADIPETEAIRFFYFDTLPHFEFLDKRKIDTTNTREGTILRQEILMTSFDSGQWVIPKFIFNEGLSTDSIVINVNFSSPFDPNQPYHDIKDVIDVDISEEKKNYWWYIAGGVVLIIALLAWLLLRKKPKAEKVVEPKDPYKDALSQLQTLRSSKQSGKKYYSELVDIFRIYISERKSISSLQKTSDDLIIQMKSLGVDRNKFEKLSQTLRLSDFVKFAKYEPSPIDDEESFEVIKTSIEEIEKMK